MSIRPRRLNPRSFLDTVEASPFALVRLDRSSRIEIHRGVAEYFDAAYPGKFVFGTLSRAEVRQQGWLEDNFHSTVGRLRHGVKDGYFLFDGRRVAGHHLGVIRPSTVSYGNEGDVEAQRERIVRLGFGGRAPRGNDLEAARQIIVYFDELVQRKQQGAGFGSGDRYVREDREPAREPENTWRERARSAPPPRRPPPPPPTPAAPDPYEVLGISRGATKEEVKKAYREGMKQNHPDRVSHLSAALQKFANQQALVIKQAYESIRDENSS